MYNMCVCKCTNVRLTQKQSALMELLVWYKANSSRSLEQ